MSPLHLERVWLIYCTRCSNQYESHAVAHDDAASECAAQGWTQECGRTFCPGCNGGAA